MKLQLKKLFFSRRNASFVNGSGAPPASAARRIEAEGRRSQKLAK
jgi:hypothetical protein